MSKLSKPLFDAIDRGDSAEVAELLRRGADPNARWFEDETPLIAAARGGPVEIVKHLLHSSADLTLTEFHGLTALMKASQQGQSEIVSCLLLASADPNQQTLPGAEPFRGWTALMHAVAGEHIGCAEMLLEHGANVSARDAYGYTALMHAAESASEKGSRWLLENGADPLTTSDDSETAISIARELGLSTLVELFQIYVRKRTEAH